MNESLECEYYYSMCWVEGIVTYRQNPPKNGYPKGCARAIANFFIFLFFLINATAVQVAELAGEKIEARLLLKQWQVGSRQVYIINQNSHI